MNLESRFAEAFESLRKARGLSLAELAREIPESEANVSRWSRGLGISITNVRKVADYFEVDRAWLEELAGYSSGATPAPHSIRPEIQTRLNRVGETLSRYPLAFQQAVLNALEAMAAAGDALQAPTNAPEISPNNHQKRQLVRGPSSSRRKLTAGYARFLALFFPLSLASTQS